MNVNNDSATPVHRFRGVAAAMLADHGMHPVNQDRIFDADAPTGDVNSGHHLDAPPGG